jgi:DNA polymerase-3 subunit alpha/error-prone DNA polymerase
MEIQKHFRRSLPKGLEYQSRLARELQLIEKFKFEQTFLQVQQILNLVPEFPHITRGSAGCSLVAYLLGIHDMNPVENNFILSRFMHESRPDLPDIDLDFAYNQRDEVVERVKRKYAGKVARISNHVTHKKNSALRTAIRETGNRNFLPKYFDAEQVCGSKISDVLRRTSELEGSFKNYSLHCGGIVIFPDSVPEELKLNDYQIKLNKDEVEERGLFKIDLLCNRAMAQFNELSSKSLNEYPEEDSATSQLFLSGNSWGVTFAESPAQRKLHKEIIPKTRQDVTFSLALIRPLPSADGRRGAILDQYHLNRNHNGHLVYDDDGIRFIQKLLNCSESEAEIYRKAFGKKKEDKIAEFSERIKYHPQKNLILKELGYFGLYSFCHAHAMSYGNLVWALAYEKTRQPKKFWWSALNHAQSMYRPWVHVQESKKAGLRFAGFGRGPWKLIGDELHPTYPDSVISGWNQYERRGYWISNRFMPDMYCNQMGSIVKFRGLIATGRHHTVNERQITFITIGTETGKYHDLVIQGIHNFDKYDIVEGIGNINSSSTNNYRITGGSIQVETFNFVKIQKQSNQMMLFP